MTSLVSYRIDFPLHISTVVMLSPLIFSGLLPRHEFESFFFSPLTNIPAVIKYDFVGLLFKQRQQTFLCLFVVVLFFVLFYFCLVLSGGTSFAIFEDETLTSNSLHPFWIKKQTNKKVPSRIERL